ncbi:chorismate lyase [Oceanimonas sp. MB9]|uniref:chorismate--pyruvate lyase family protein n=1 Tax=Oceanimonas sp. MB9 TaxID=2588453 RepID=UPI0013F671FE|nr:chorismate lyase [Oceanimonas sp. MB9]NHH99050.1 Chorismate pyruvate-lyase [Oceanimonas sp. MB9]
MSLLFDEQNTASSADHLWRWGSETPAAPVLNAWLHDTGSLTRLLRRHCRQFEVQLLSDASLRSLTPTQAELLGCDQAFCREVLLCCDGRPWVYASSLYSSATQRALPALAGLGSRALGELMFEAPDLERTPFEFARLNATEYRRLAERTGLNAGFAPAPWARRSTLSTGAARVLVTELFLPASALYQDTMQDTTS